MRKPIPGIVGAVLLSVVAVLVAARTMSTNDDPLELEGRVARQLERPAHVDAVSPAEELTESPVPISAAAGDNRDGLSAAGSPEYVWITYTRTDGLPSNKVFAVRVDGDRLWIGTDDGLVLREMDTFRTYSVEDGLAHS
ncbi:MAG: hypothetical protein R3178_08700, partial [Rhodothermales bacterium]|nr:hypothetical protein [Rhodothermales bacterium]